MLYSTPELKVFGTVAELTGYVGGTSGADALYINGDTAADAVAFSGFGDGEREQSCFYNRVSNSFTFMGVTGGASASDCQDVLEAWQDGSLDGIITPYVEY